MPGRLNLITDIPGVRVGHADNAGIATGVTAILLDAPNVASGVIRGGAPREPREGIAADARRRTGAPCSTGAASAAPWARLADQTIHVRGQAAHGGAIVPVALHRVNASSSATAS